MKNYVKPMAPIDAATFLAAWGVKGPPPRVIRLLALPFNLDGLKGLRTDDLRLDAAQEIESQARSAIELLEASAKGQFVSGLTSDAERKAARRDLEVALGMIVAAEILAESRGDINKVSSLLVTAAKIVARLAVSRRQARRDLAAESAKHAFSEEVRRKGQSAAGASSGLVRRLRSPNYQLAYAYVIMEPKFSTKSKAYRALARLQNPWPTEKAFYKAIKQAREDLENPFTAQRARAFGEELLARWRSLRVTKTLH